MANFNQAIQIVLKNEGGYVNDPMDAGGETNYGICKRDNQKMDIKNLTEEKAIAYYEKNWWNKFGFGTITNDKLASWVFDHAVNAGPVPIIRALQLVIQDAMQNSGNFEGITIDGILGPNTAKLVNEFYNDNMLLALQEKVWNHYLKIIEANPTDQKFYHGWHNRVFQN